MSEHVTDEAVEKAAQALHDLRSMRSHALHEVGEPLGNTVYDNERRADARAALEAATPAIAAKALRDAADAWQTGEWSDSMPHGASRPALILGMAQRATNWLRARANRIERGES